jgi:hypothetical protein
MFKMEELESEWETDSLPVHSNYIHSVLRRKAPHDPAFGFYQDDNNVSFKIVRSSFTYNDKHIFVVGKSTGQLQVSGNYWPSHKLIKTWSLFKANRHINELYSSPMRIELIIVLQVGSGQTKTVNIRGITRDCLRNVMYLGNRYNNVFE